MIMSFKRYTLQTKCALILMFLIVGLIFLTSSSGKADANRMETAGDFKESLVIRSDDGPVSNRHDNIVSPSEDREVFHEEMDIVRPDEMESHIGMKEAAEINLSGATTKEVENKKDPEILSASNNLEIHSENKLSETDEPESEQSVEELRGVPQQQNSSVDSSSRGISDSKKSSGLPEKYNLDNELESIDQINTIGEKKWQEVDDQSIILRVSWKYYYLLVLSRPIGMKYSNPSVGLSSTSSITAGIDRVFVEPSSSTQGYIIEKIYKLKGREQAEVIKERLHEN